MPWPPPIAYERLTLTVVKRGDGYIVESQLLPSYQSGDVDNDFILTLLDDSWGGDDRPGGAVAKHRVTSKTLTSAKRLATRWQKKFAQWHTAGRSP